MAKRISRAALIALVVCGVSFYLAYFAALIYHAVSGSLNTATARPLQAFLRHVALPASLAVAAMTFALAFRHGGSQGAPSKADKGIPGH